MLRGACLMSAGGSSWYLAARSLSSTPSLPTEITPARIPCFKTSWKSPTDMRIPTLKFKMMFESNPLKSGILVRRLAVALRKPAGSQAARQPGEFQRDSQAGQLGETQPHQTQTLITLIIISILILI